MSGEKRKRKICEKEKRRRRKINRRRRDNGAAGVWQFEATSVGNQANGQFSYAAASHQERRQGGQKQGNETKCDSDARNIWSPSSSTSIV